MNKYFTLFFVFLLYVSLSADWQSVNENYNNLISCQETEQGIWTIEFTLNGYECDQVMQDGVVYDLISHPEGKTHFESGLPDLPVFTAMIAIPHDQEISVNWQINGSTRLENMNIMPLQLKKDKENKQVFTKNHLYYSQGGNYPTENVIISTPAIMRDLCVLTVSISPFIYNARSKTLEISSSIEIEIATSGGEYISTQRSSTLRSRVFEPLYDSMVLNYREIEERTQYQQPAIVYIISDNTSALETLEYLKDWKVQKGYDVTVATTAETGTSTTAIKSWLQNAYDNWENPPEYVCFCGDASGTFGIPAWSNGDHGYSELAGNDYLEDVILGRLSFEDINTFQVMVSKILNYEKEPFMDNTAWYQQAVLAGDPSISGPSMVFTCQSVKEMMLDYEESFNDEDNFTEIYSGSIASSINTALNSGASYMVYRGWLGMSGWDPGGQSNSFMLPFATLLTCGTGSWTYGTSDSEAFARQGSVSNPTGAIGAVGMSTAGTHSCFNNALTLGIYGGIFVDQLYSMGAAVTKGKYYLHETFPQNPQGYVSTYHDWANLIGEPSLQLWTNTPQEMTVIYDYNPALGTNYLSVSVRGEANQPLAGAWVTISDEDENFLCTEFCDDNGEVLMDISATVESEYNIVVTHHNYIPHLGTVEVEQQDYSLDIDAVTYDDTSGNNDGLLNAGETVYIYPSLHNYGTQTLMGVSATCELEHDYLQLNTANIDYPSIAGQSSAVSAEGIALEIDPAALGGMQGLLHLIITDNDNNSWDCWHYLNIEDANLFVTDYEISGADVLEPGEQAEIYFTFENTGSVASDELDIHLHSQSPHLIIADSLSTLAPVAAGESGNNSGDTFTVTPSLQVIPGTQITLEIELSSDDGYYQICYLVVTVGIPEETDPLGPDEYGYWCFDDSDVGYESCPTYNWIEIDPDLNGEGTIIPLSDGGDSGDSEVIDVPQDFTLMFYGEQYDELTVCSNGWIAPGAHEGANFMNHPLPGPEGPNPMIAVFWDDLSVNNGNVCWYYDDMEHILIIEWSDIRNGDTNASETFQVILYDPDIYHTMTGDCLIKMQYNEINNNNAGSYPSNHGQYCTIGLENDGAQTGLNYTFNNTYPASCKILQDEMAILFSPPQYPEYGPYMEMAAYEYLSGDDLFIEAGETVELSLLLANQGAEEANDLQVEINIDDQWFEIIDGNAYIEHIEPLQTVELTGEFSFAVSEEVPDNYQFNVVVNMSTADDSWQNYFTLTAHWTNAFYLETDSLNVTLGVDLTAQRSFVLANTSAQTVNYYLRVDDSQITSRDISGSEVTCDTEIYYPGEEMVWEFTVYNNSQGNEWVSDVWLSFPPGVEVTYAHHAHGGSGGSLYWDETIGDGVTINWHGETSNGWGVLHDGESATWNVFVTIGDNFASDIQVGWQIGGDGYGNEPHQVSGEINFDFFVQWFSLNTSYGTLESGQSEEIFINFDTFHIEPGEYDCTIDILSDSWFAEEFHTHLTVVAVDDNIVELPAVTSINSIFPNPFNPHTYINFSLAESQQTIVAVYNIRGQKVKTLLNGVLPSGDHQLQWQGDNDMGNAVSSGIYYLQMHTQNKRITRKMLLLK